MSELNSIRGQTVRLRFTTREDHLQLTDSAPVLIPTTFRRYQLSQYVNSQLDLSQPIPFEFLVNGSYLRTSVDEYLTQNGVSTENTLTVEYVRARIPPRYVASYEHDDWVSDVDVRMDNSKDHPRILTASYDGRVRVWNTSSQVLAASGSAAEGGHSSFVKSAKFVTPSQIVSASYDRTVKLWDYQDAPDGSSSSLKLKSELYGHKAGIESVAAHSDSYRLLTAGADHTVGFWSTRKKDAPPAPESAIPKAITKDGKRRKLNPATSAPQYGPLALMQAHTAPVSDVCFDHKDSTVAYSSSLDHTVRTWDLVTGTPVDARTTNTPLFCVEQLPSIQLLATGSASRDIKLVDPRDSAVSAVAMILKGHKNHVVALAKDPDNEYALASGSHDGSCRIWDVRSVRGGKEGMMGQSVFTISRESLRGKAIPVTGEGIKVFGICWSASVGILSAGEDKAVQVNSSEDLS